MREKFYFAWSECPRARKPLPPADTRAWEMELSSNGHSQLQFGNEGRIQFRVDGCLWTGALLLPISARKWNFLHGIPQYNLGTRNTNGHGPLLFPRINLVPG